MRYDDQQLAYIRCTTTNNVVIGNPGSGKTTALKGRLDYMLQSHPVESQFVLTFYKSTQEYLEVRLQNIFGAHTRQQVRTVHSVCYALVANMDVSTAIVRALRLNDDAFLAFFKNVRNVYIDEAQTLDQYMMDFVQKLKRVCHWVSVDVLGDAAQNCRTEVASQDEEFMLQYTHGNVYELVNNYRSATEIVNFCVETHPFKGLTAMRATRTDKGVVELFVGDQGRQLNHLHTKLLAIPHNQTVGIICACRHAHPGMPTHICCQDVANFLHHCGIPFNVWYDETRSRSDFSTVRREEGHIVITTIHGSLGREFDHAFVFSYHHKTNKRVPTHAQHYHHQKLFHIARSRAIRALYMFAGHDMDLFITSESAMSHVTLTGGQPPKLIKNLHQKSVFKPQEENEKVQMLAFGSLGTLDPARLMKLQDLFRMSYNSTSEWDTPGPHPSCLPEYGQLKTLYGLFAENIVYSGNGCCPEQQALQHFTNGSTIVIPNGERDEVQHVMKELNLISSRMRVTRLHLQSLHEKSIRLYKSNAAQKRRKRATFYKKVGELLEDILSQSEEKCVTLHFEHPNIWHDAAKLREWANAPLSEETVFNICLFWWQYENHAAWRMETDYTKHLKSLEALIPNWLALGQKWNGHSQVPCLLTHPSFPDHKLMGQADTVITGDDKNPPIVIEWKFATAGLTTNHRLQLALYTHTMNQNSNEVHKSLLGNLYTGEIQEVFFEFVTCDNLFNACFAEEEAEDTVHRNES